MLKRKIDEVIENHYKNNKSALLLTGARQTGKTFAIRKYAQTNNLDLVEINFLDDPTTTMIFENASGIEDIMLRITAYCGKNLNEKTLIFFDEVQKCPESVTMIKFLVDKTPYKYALSGSLLGIELKNIRSVPVGYMSIVETFPLNFEEFVKAIGVADKILEHLRKAYEDKKEVDPVVHNQMLKLFQLYIVVGGMPAAVQKFIDTKNISSAQQKQKEILDLYKLDISQYDPDNKLYINEIFDLIPSELNAKNKRFILKNLNEKSRFSIYENGFLWLKDAGAAIPVYNVEEPRYPLLLNKQRNLFKLFQNDVGLLTSQYAQGTALSLLSGKQNINFGAIYENVVAQELLSNGFGNLYYFNSKKQGEVDFVIEKGDGQILPIEVKSGKDYAFHLALNNILGTSEYNIPDAIVLCNDNLSVKGKVTYLPIYMTMFLQRKYSYQEEYIPDISALT